MELLDQLENNADTGTDWSQLYFFSQKAEPLHLYTKFVLKQDTVWCIPEEFGSPTFKLPSWLRHQNHTLLAEFQELVGTSIAPS